MVLYCGEEDELVVRAATGALAMMTHNEKICKKVLEVETQTTSTKFLSLSITWYNNISPLSLSLSTTAMVTRNLIEGFVILKQVNQWQEILLSTVVSENMEIQHRGCFVLKNLLSVDKETAEKVIEGQMLEVLMALSIQEDPKKEVVKKCAATCLEICVEHGLIKPKEWGRDRKGLMWENRVQ